MARTLIGNPCITDLTGGEENKFVFDSVTSSALSIKKLPRETIEKYFHFQLLAGSKHFLDQSHPNLWHIERLLMCFPKAKFIAMVRCPYSVTYSTLNHKGVSGHFSRFEEYPHPNPFFGTQESITNNYASLSIASKSALRWCSHMSQIDKLCRRYPDSMRAVNYEDLCLNTSQVLASLRDFLEVASDTPKPIVRLGSLSKKDNLKGEEVDDIKKQVSSYFEVNPLPDEVFVPLSRYA